MKKIIVLLLVVFSLNIKVQASTSDVYYSEYSDFSEYSEVQISSSELIDVDIERRYRWYKNNITSEFLLYDEGIAKYELVDMENYQESEYSDWQYVKPNSITGRVIEETEEYKVRKLKPIQSLMIGNFSFNQDNVYLGEIEIYAGNHKIDFESICGGCSEENNFESTGFMMIDFFEPYYMKDITIKFINTETEYINNFKIYAVEPMMVDIPSNIYASYTYQSSQENNILLTEKDFNIVNPRYEEEVIYDVLPDVSSLDYVEVNTKYRYQDKYYYFYNVEKEYIDGYYSDYPKYIKDETDYKDYYRYRTREKIVIDNEMTITRYKEKLDDFVVATTDYQIESDINYLKNGVYSVRYITPFQTITKEVTVDIEENDLRTELEELKDQYNSLIEEYNSNQKQIDELKDNIKTKEDMILNLENSNLLNEQQLSSNIVKYEDLLSEYNQLNNKYQSTDISYLNSLKQEQEKCSNELTTIKLKNDDYEKKLKLSNQANDYLQKSMLNIKQNNLDAAKINIIPFILLGLAILLLIIIMIKKMSIKK